MMRTHHQDPVSEIRTIDIVWWPQNDLPLLRDRDDASIPIKSVGRIEPTEAYPRTDQLAEIDSDLLRSRKVG
jgi:hypothetical protein